MAGTPLGTLTDVGRARPVVVVGSGAAGLAAALGASSAGAEVLLLEAGPAVGGTSAMSGGVVWCPGHGRGGAGDDGPARATAYLEALAHGDVDAALMRSFVSGAAPVVDEIEQRTPLEWDVLEHWPDYRSDLPGGSAGGRSLWPRPVCLDPGIERRVQPAFDQPSPPQRPGDGGRRGAGLADATGAPAHDGVVLRGHVRGRALCAALLAGVLGAGVEVRTGARARAVVQGASGVRGVAVGRRTCTGRVVLATGGFQHDGFLVARHLPGPPVAPMGTPGCVGDGLRMAEALGSELGNMGEGWWMPAMHVPGEALDGVEHFRPLHSERAKPGAIVVDGSARRFVDEAQSYGDVGRAMRRRDAGPYWLVCDAAYRARYPLGPLEPGDEDPEWLARGHDLRVLARRLGLAPAALEDTVARFNEGAARGVDEEFGRGTRPYASWIGDPAAPHPTLAPLREPPFYAVAVHLGCMGTKGGPRTDECGRVRSRGGGVVPGLYAAGNAAASPFGSATAAGGATLGPALVFGFRAGAAAATDP